MNIEPAHVQARRLSSGTLAGLIGNNRYTVIDRIQAEFTAFAERAAEDGKPFPSWQVAWVSFQTRR
jgi:hypothetical protein